MARVLIVGGGCRGRLLAAELTAQAYAVRISTRTEVGRAAIEAVGAECWIGTPDRLATMRAALDGVTVACWLLATASGGEEELAGLHSSRLQAWMTQAIDTTVRGIVYESGGARGGPPREGAALARALAERNSIPFAELAADPGDEGWVAAARVAIDALMRGS